MMKLKDMPFFRQRDHNDRQQQRDAAKVAQLREYAQRAQNDRFMAALDVAQAEADVARQRIQQRDDQMRIREMALLQQQAINVPQQAVNQVFQQNMGMAAIRYEYVGGGYGGLAQALNQQQAPEPRANWVLGFPLIKGQKQTAALPDRVTFESYDDQGRYHNETGPALVLDGCSKYYFWHGMATDSFVIESHEKITVKDILDRGYAESRRSAIERYVGVDASDGFDGYKRFVRDIMQVRPDYIKILDENSRFGTLVVFDDGRDEKIAMVRVTNRTVEPDGTYKTYYLRVPPIMKTAREAVAWSFGLKSDEYDPKIES